MKTLEGIYETLRRTNFALLTKELSLLSKYVLFLPVLRHKQVIEDRDKLAQQVEEGYTEKIIGLDNRIGELIRMYENRPSRDVMHWSRSFCSVIITICIECLSRQL